MQEIIINLYLEYNKLITIKRIFFILFMVIFLFSYIFFEIRAKLYFVK